MMYIGYPLELHEHLLMPSEDQCFEKKEIAGRAFPAEYPGLEIYPILANDICPNEKLDDIAIEYRFLNDELVAINFIALNDDQNIPSEKLTLMNYVKKTYGDFDTTNNPKAYNDFHIFEAESSIHLAINIFS